MARHTRQKFCLWSSCSTNLNVLQEHQRRSACLVRKASALQQRSLYAVFLFSFSFCYSQHLFSSQGNIQRAESALPAHQRVKRRASIPFDLAKRRRLFLRKPTLVSCEDSAA